MATAASAAKTTEAVESTPAAAAAAAAAAEPTMTDLEAAMAAYSAANPVDGRKLAEHIAKLQRKFESTKRKADELEEHARVDKDVLRNQLQQLVTHLSPEVTKQYCIDDSNIDAQILSDKNGIAHNAVHRVIAACNATFMATPASAPTRATPPPATEPAAKRQKQAEPAPEPVDVPVQLDTDGDEAALRRALRAVYD